MPARSVRLYAHRGASAELPENTIPAFRRALEVGADALEMDIHGTRDGHVVVSHDPDGVRLAGVPARIRDSTLEQVKRWDLGRSRGIRGRDDLRVPALEEVLLAFPDVVLNLDIKQEHPSIVESTLALIARHRAEERVILASFSSRTMRRVRELGYRGLTALAPEEVARALATPAFLWRRRAPEHRGTAAQIPVRQGPFVFGSPRMIDHFHARGLRVDFWTVNAPGEARRLLELGADGIMTDDPASIAPVFAAFRESGP